MPDPALQAVSLFDKAKNAVAAWLDGIGSDFAARETSPGTQAKLYSWRLAEFREGLKARLVLPLDFPATPAQIYISKELCLVLPHVEEDGRVCLSIKPKPGDYDSPAHAVGDVLTDFQRFVDACRDADWVDKEFQSERTAYWIRFSDAVRVRHQLNTPRQIRAAVGSFDAYADGDLALYRRQPPSKRASIALATVGTVDANVLSHRHGWARGVYQKGHTLFVRMPDEAKWTPSTWARSFGELQSLVGGWTAQEVELSKWLKDKQDGKEHPYLIVLIQGPATFGYYILPPAVPGLTEPTVVPVNVERVDPDWGLARDHQLPILQSRRSKRVLLLGCGSLGSPIAELLARAGIGYLSLVDMQTFKPENTSRHVLGYSSTDKFKAVELALQLRKEVPGLKVDGRAAIASNFVEVAVTEKQFDLVIDCTGESAVRVLLGRLKEGLLADTPVAMAWAEPMCAAGHLVWLNAGDCWPQSDPADVAVNIATWNADTAVRLPACGVSFHPYGASDIWQIAAFCCERLLSHIDGAQGSSTVWTWTRGTKFFEDLGNLAVPGPLVPVTQYKHDSCTFQRDFSYVTRAAREG